MDERKLYTSDGYLNVPYIYETMEKLKAPNCFIVGGRGTGKTYGWLKYLTENNIPHIFAQRTEQKMKILATPNFNVYKTLNDDCGWNYEYFKVPGTGSAIYEAAPAELDKKGKLRPAGPPIQTMIALSTFSNVRGFDGSAYDVFLYDEFIKEPTERTVIKDEATALFNAYETINRNRELKGKPPVKLICLANANDVTNPIFTGLELVNIAYKMNQTGQVFRHEPKRGMILINMDNSPISKAKQDTALYKLTAGTAYSKMALGNDWAFNSFEVSRSRPLREYKPLVKVGELTIWRHRSKNLYYVTPHAAGSPPAYGTSEIELTRFTARYMGIWRAHLSGCVEFENVACETLFCRIYGFIK